MSDDPIVSTNGDMFRIRQCDECNGVVIEIWRGRPDTNPPKDDEPDVTIDIPPDVVSAVIAAMQEIKYEVCEECNAPATERDCDGIPLCRECYDDLVADDEPPATGEVRT